MSRVRARFSVLVVTYNSREDVSALLTDVERLAPQAGVVLVDNASQDRTVEHVVSRFPRVVTIANNRNLGYASAINQGLRRCTTEFVFLFNPDIRLPDPDFFGLLLGAARSSSRVAAVGPLQYQPRADGLHLDLTWSYWSPAGLRLYFGRRFGRAPSACLNVPFLNAGCLLLRRSALFEIGLLNERYFLYGEEPDLCLKLRRLGYECRLEPRTWVVHRRESSLSTWTRPARLGVRLKGLLNIADALLRGYAGLLWAFVRKERSTA